MPSAKLSALAGSSFADARAPTRFRLFPAAACHTRRVADMQDARHTPHIDRAIAGANQHTSRAGRREQRAIILHGAMGNMAMAQEGVMWQWGNAVMWE